ncbi:MAG: hypothetical protein AAF270_12980 [Pseudomonadota bacterium]
MRKLHDSSDIEADVEFFSMDEKVAKGAPIRALQLSAALAAEPLLGSSAAKSCYHWSMSKAHDCLGKDNVRRVSCPQFRSQ